MLRLVIALLMGTTGLSLTVLFVVLVGQWWRDGRKVPFAELLARSRWNAYSPALSTALGLWGADQLTDSFQRWPDRGTTWAALLLVTLYILHGPIGIIVNRRKVKELASSREPIIDEREQLITLHVGRAIGLGVLVVLAVRGTWDLVAEGEAALSASIFTFLLTNPYYQTILIGLVIGLLANGYYRRRAL